MTPDPSDRLYPWQKEVVDRVVGAFDDGRDAVMLDAPTGSGKSVIHAELAKRLGCRVFVTTPQRTLVYQMRDDPLFRSIAPGPVVMIGRENFDCHRDPSLTVDRAVCYELRPNGAVDRRRACQYKRWRKDEDEMPACGYYRQKAEAELAPVVVTTLAYFLVGTVKVRGKAPSVPAVGWDAGRLSGRDLLIVDEAHGLESAVVQHLTTSWTGASYTEGSYPADFDAWRVGAAVDRWAAQPKPDDAELARVLHELIVVLEDHAAGLESRDSQEAFREAEAIGRDVDLLGDAVADVEAGIPWCAAWVDGRRPRFELRPVLVGPHLGRTMWNRARRFVLSSGTFLDPEGYVADLGLRGKKIRHIRVPSRFPPENAPIVRIPAARLSFQTKDAALPAIARMLWRVVDREPGRGLVHTQSFDYGRRLMMLCPPRLQDRVVLHHAESDRDGLIEEFTTRSPKGTVLLSPSLTEGIDLAGEKGEWVAFVKAPFAQTTDDRVAKRMAMPDGRRWYEQQAVERTVQGRGRVVRSETDRARCYILDQAHVDLLKRWWSVLPDWFAAPCLFGDDIARTLLVETMAQERGVAVA